MAWAPNSGAHICTVGDDKQALIWDIGSGVLESVNFEKNVDPVSVLS
jgi:hypothetical protein